MNPKELQPRKGVARNTILLVISGAISAVACILAWQKAEFASFGLWILAVLIGAGVLNMLFDKELSVRSDLTPQDRSSSNGVARKRVDRLSCNQIAGDVVLFAVEK